MAKFRQLLIIGKYSTPLHLKAVLPMYPDSVPNTAAGKPSLTMYERLLRFRAAGLIDPDVARRIWFFRASSLTRSNGRRQIVTLATDRNAKTRFNHAIGGSACSNAIIGSCAICTPASFADSISTNTNNAVPLAKCRPCSASSRRASPCA